jgi:MIP family channel proteins
MNKELRCYLAEFIGVFVIVLIGCGSIAALSSEATKHVAVNIAFGAAVATMIYTLGHISRAHFNPAVTLGFAIGGRISWRCAVGYWASQFLGAIAGCAVLRAVPGFTTTGPTTSQLPPLVTVLLEAVLTFILMLVIVGTAVDKRANPGWAGLAIGATVTMNGLFAGPLTGNSLNPTRSFGPALFEGGQALSQVWMYFVGPCIGASLAMVAYRALVTEKNLHECNSASCC